MIDLKCKACFACIFIFLLISGCDILYPKKQFTDFPVKSNIRDNLIENQNILMSNFKEQKLFASDGVQSDQFGYSVSVSGDYAIAGAPFTGGAGAAYIYKKNRDKWELAQKITADDCEAGDNFGCSVTISGDYALVGSCLEDGGTGDPRINSGAVYVFEREGGGWIQKDVLRASDAQAGDEFGISVAFEGGHAIIGAHYEDGGSGNPASNCGAAYIYELKADGSFMQMTALHASDLEQDDDFGISVAIYGGWAVVGAQYEAGELDNPKADAGAIYVYKLTADDFTEVWEEDAKLLAQDRDGGDEFGYSVSIFGDTIIAGAYGRDDPHESGSAYIYKNNGISCLYSRRFDAYPYRVQSDAFGYSSAAGEDYAIIGVPFDDNEKGTDSGSAYIIKESSGIWEQQKIITGSDTNGGEQFGCSVSISGDNMIVGLRCEDDKGSDSGAAYIYSYDRITDAAISADLPLSDGSEDFLIFKFAKNANPSLSGVRSITDKISFFAFKLIQKNNADELKRIPEYPQSLQLDAVKHAYAENDDFLFYIVDTADLKAQFLAACSSIAVESGWQLVNEGLLQVQYLAGISPASVYLSDGK
jgi:hypothetical protein